MKTLGSKRTKKDIRNGKAQKIRLIDEYLKKISMWKIVCIHIKIYVFYSGTEKKIDFFDVTDWFVAYFMFLACL